jgi:hypothetical protein
LHSAGLALPWVTSANDDDYDEDKGKVGSDKATMLMMMARAR